MNFYNLEVFIIFTLETIKDNGKKKFYFKRLNFLMNV